ncbi:MAG: DUF2298 domain-containing protein [Anaerolineales bacterium]|jgi:YYY domain-containing protein|nr:DUF2298 domain-containing protein [Anaerolineales bacterium]
MINFILWYLLMTALGLLTFPLAYRLLPALPERGYALSRALGLLLWGFIFWLAVSFGLARNNLGGLFASLLVLVAFSLWWGRTRAEDAQSPLDWLKAHWNYILVVEILFLLAFAGLAFVRSHAPEALGTEKPMELAFINAVLRSETFPPNDPWLSGYAISYYYFGYVLTGMLAKFTATSGGVAFNLMIALVFGMSAVGAYGLLYNFLTLARKRSALFPALLGPLFLLIVSNLEGFLEVLHRLGIGWNGSSGPFWAWLNMRDLSMPPAQPLGWIPERFWWWWRAARVLHDYDLQGTFVEVIDEFPFFSYLLADLHPHVLAMPFGLLAIGLALNLYLGGWAGEIDLRFTKIPLVPRGFAILAVALGGLAFLNTWDLPVYLALTGLGLAFYRIRQQGWAWARLEELLVFGFTLGLSAILLYFPFYVSFSSQAGGILPNIVFPTRGAYLWIMFGALFVPLFLFLLHLRSKLSANLRLGFGLALGLTIFLWLFSVVAGLALANTDAIRQFITSQGATGAWDVLQAATLRRFEFVGGLATLVLLLGMTVAYLTAIRAEAQAVPARTSSPEHGSGGQSPQAQSVPLPFLLLMILLGGLLVLAPEFVYLRDGFGNRMNTVFKFYYQAWTLWSLAAAFAFVTVFSGKRAWLTWAARIVLLLVTGMGLAYPVLSLPNRANYFRSAQPSLDAGGYLARSAPEDAALVEFLSSQPFGVVLEAATNNSYTEYGRIATHSGLQAVLGWGWHEWQWRGSDQAYAGREADIRVLYETPSWDRAREVLVRYNVRYLVLGELERRTYQVNQQKFAALPELIRFGDTVLYLVPERP